MAKGECCKTKSNEAKAIDTHTEGKTCCKTNKAEGSHSESGCCKKEKVHA